MVRAAIVLRLLPLKFGWRYIDRSYFREIARYSSVTFMVMIAYKLRFKTDEVIISTFLSLSAVTFFSNADRLLDYTGEVVSSLSQVFLPLSGHSNAHGDMNQLRKLFVAGNRACALIVFPISATLIILGKSIITAWVGPRYVTASYPVMICLLIPYTLVMAQDVSGRILYGMARHKSLALVTGMEAIANLVLSIVLIRPFGIMGDALGTAIPLSCTALFFIPRHLCRVLNIRLLSYLREAFVLPLMLCAPTVGILLLMRWWFFARNYAQVGMQILISLIPYGLGLAWALWTKRIWNVPQLPSGRGFDEVGTALIGDYQEKL
jgi:O-antigen/teichoic acid export membrane protein